MQCTEYKVEFKDIVFNPSYINIIKPPQQGSLDDDRVQELIQEYLENPSLLVFKNKILLGLFDDNLYIVDGQHRLDMARQLYEMGKSGYLLLCIYKCDDRDDMDKLFNSANKDSIKNNNYVGADIYTKLIIKNFVNDLKKYHAKDFAARKTQTSKIKTIEELRDDLIEIGYFDQMNNSDKALQQLRNKNDEFYKLKHYSIDILHNEKQFYKCEVNYITNGFIASLKNNNFIAWLKNGETPYHIYKQPKYKLTAKQREKIWKHYYDVIEVKCPISFCKNMIKNDKNGWHAGHMISEYNGGSTSLDNIRPICCECNVLMGSQNWDKFDNL